MAQYEKVPVYVAATPQQVAEARKQLILLRGNSAFALMQERSQSSRSGKV